LNYIEGYLKRFGAQCKRLVFKGGHPKRSYPVDNLYAEWRFGEDPKHLCFIGHTDVVAPGDANKWSKNPFDGELDNGWLHGRGATDMKGAVAAFCTAVTQTIDLLKDQSICVSIILTTDEEWAAVNGTKKVLDWLKKSEKKIDVVVVGEPSSSDRLGSHIKIGRRGSLCGKLTVTGIQGHAAYRELFENPNRALSLAGTILNSYRWEYKDSCFPPTNFELVAQHSGNFCETAIIPDKAKSVWNIRFTPQYQVDQIYQTLLKILANPPKWAVAHPDFKRLGKVMIHANTDTAAQPYYSKPGPFADLVSHVVSKVTKETPKLDGGGGITDGRFVHKFFPAAQIIELGLPEKGGRNSRDYIHDYGKRGGMHQIDERCSVKDLEDLLLCYQEIILQFAKEGHNC
jgi:succinyl-diaminopimelate desuccinylase